MTIKLIVVKSGEDIIADVNEMVVGEEDNPRVVGYFLKKPCLVKMVKNEYLGDNIDGGKEYKTQVDLYLYPWMPLSKDDIIPLNCDWVVTMLNPTDSLKEMYLEEVLKYGKTSQNSITDEQSDSNNSD